MTEPIKGTCTGCGREFLFQPINVKKNCQVCGAKVQLPADYAQPEFVQVGCPICGRSKEIDKTEIGGQKPCWCCGALLFIPMKNGTAPLVMEQEKPAAPELDLTAPSDDTVTLDANHPLTGFDLTFKVERISIGLPPAD